MMARDKFTIIANPRTGSNFFIERLNCHSEITCHREIFHRHSVYLEEGTRNDLLEERNRDPQLFLSKVFQQCPTLVCGFKIFDDQNPDVLKHVIINPDIKKIILYRQNFLAVYSSDLLATESKEYVKFSNDSLLKSLDGHSNKVVFDADKFQKAKFNYENHYRHVVETLNNSGQYFLFTCYEEFCNENLFRRTFSYLNLPQPRNVESRLVKMNHYSILDRFLNPDDVFEAMKAIGHVDWCYDSFIQWSPVQN